MNQPIIEVKIFDRPQIYKTYRPGPQVFINGFKGKAIKRDTRFTYSIPKAGVYFKMDSDKKIYPSQFHANYKNHTANQLKCWNDYKKEPEVKYLCPIITNGKHNGLTWIVQPKCNTNKTMPYDVLNELEEIAGDMGIMDMGSYQCGYYEGNPVIFDYGMYGSSHWED